MTALHFNCASGISGDMFVSSLLSLGVSFNYLEEELKKLNLANYKIEVKPIVKNGVNSVSFKVKTKEEIVHRHLTEINQIISNSSLTQEIKDLSKKIFLTLGHAEAKAHNTPIEKVHFHEVGAIDSIIDIVSAAILIKKINPKKITCSPISIGYGPINIAHGKVDLPVPAVRNILKGIPTTVININKELTTPTGAAIIKTITDEFADFQIINPISKGFGAGSRNLPFPNILEVYKTKIKSRNTLILLETNIDDMNPELYQAIIEKIMDLGAADVFIQPLIMKKNRVGVLLSVLCTENLKNEMTKIIFHETTTFGIRISNIQRETLDRKIIINETQYGDHPFKVGYFDGNICTSKPEYEKYKKLANDKKIPIREVYINIVKNKEDFS